MHSLEEIIRMNNPKKQETVILTFHTDLGHGWLEVPKKLAKSLDFRISPYSYQDSKNLYLEEDCDAEAFSNAAKEAGLKVQIVHKNFEGNHPIRNKDRVIDPLYKSHWQG